MERLLKGIVTFLVVITMSTHCIAHETITVLNGEWAPYTSKKLKHYGVSSHIVTEAFALSGIRVRYAFYPWARIGKMVKTGEDGGITLIHTKTPESETYAAYSDPMLVAKSVFFHLKRIPFEWDTVDDLREVTLGGTLSYNYGPEIRAAEKNGTIEIQWVSTDLQSFKKLLAQRIDIFPIALDVGYTLLNAEFSKKEAEQITHHPKPYATQKFHVMISMKNRSHERLIRLFNHGLNQLKETGTFDRYYEASRRGDYLMGPDPGSLVP